jgi:hypothetical protein
LVLLNLHLAGRLRRAGGRGRIASTAEHPNHRLDVVREQKIGLGRERLRHRRVAVLRE